MMNRRRFLCTVPPGLALLNASCRSLWAVADPVIKPLVFSVHTDQQVGEIPQNVMGLSYESTQLGEPDYFSPANRDLIRIFQTLSPHGNLRLGGDTSEFTYFKANASVQAPAYTPAPTQPKELTPITMEALHNLRGFLNATGWTCIYGLNFGTGTPQRAAEEAAAVMRILGPKLEYLQIGNEPNNYIRYRLRPDTWNEKVFLAEWLSFARVIVQQLPTAKLAGPDMGAVRPWMELFAHNAVSELKKNLVAMTDHFYAEGPPSAPLSTMQTLLSDPRKIDAEIDVMKDAAHISSLPIRMTEINSCYSGGKPGVSNTLGSALWGGDMTLKLVASGFCGINFHGGSAKHIRASLGGEMPGDKLSKSMADDSYYTPIAGNAKAGYTPRPLYYGMLMVGRMAGSVMVAGSFSKPQTVITSYASLNAKQRTLQIALFNKWSEAADLLLAPGKPFHSASALRLTGADVEATDGIRFGNAAVAHNGSWTPSAPETLRRTPSDECRITLPPASAALVYISLT
jgi:hypothetical protein